MSFDVKIGKKLHHARILRGMTQQELAQKLGISFQQVQKYEKGKNKIPFERLCALSKLLDLPLKSWCGEQYEMPESLEREMENRHVLMLIHSYQRIPTPRHQQLVREFADALGGMDR